MRKRKDVAIAQEATVLLEKAQKMFKLVTTEGNFMEVIDYKDRKSIFLGLIPQKKRALLIVNTP